MRGQVEIVAKIRPDRSAVLRNALLAFELESEDGAPVGGERADELRELGFSYSDRIGYYKYLRTGQGRFTTHAELTLPDGVRMVAATARRWHRLETPLRLDELTFVSRE